MERKTTAKNLRIRGGLAATLNRLTNANGKRWYEHVLTRDSNVLSELNFEMVEKKRVWASKDDMEKAGK